MSAYGMVNLVIAREDFCRIKELIDAPCRQQDHSWEDGVPMVVLDYRDADYARVGKGRGCGFKETLWENQVPYSMFWNEEKVYEEKQEHFRIEAGGKTVLKAFDSFDPREDTFLEELMTARQGGIEEIDAFIVERQAYQESRTVMSWGEQFEVLKDRYSKVPDIPF